MDEDLFEELFSSPESSDLDSDAGSGDESEDTGNQRSWDPHAGMKPSCWHGYRSEDEVDLEDECYSSFDLSSIYAVKYHLTTRIRLYQLSFLISTILGPHSRFPTLSDLPDI